jgi:dihydroorotate dehydrogenase
MKLRGIDFDVVRTASGVLGFFGEGYWFHSLPLLSQWYAPLDEIGFTSKTATLLPREGNLSRKDFLPKCVKVYPLRGGGLVLNAVGLSNPGLPALLFDGRWYRRKKPFMISLAAVGSTIDRRHDERREMAKLLAHDRDMFSTVFGIQENMSCPNVDVHSLQGEELKMHNLDEAFDSARKRLYGAFVQECHEAREIFARYLPGVPQQVKLSLLTPVDVATEIVSHEHCDAIAISNALPFGELPQYVFWDQLFGGGDPRDDSPLAEFGGGAISGMPLFLPTFFWLHQAGLLIEKPIEVGGGILGSGQVEVLAQTRIPVAVTLGSISLLRPHMIPQTITTARAVLPRSV